MTDRTLITVTGAVPAAEAGFCHSHEHLFIRKGRSWETATVLMMEDVEKSAAEAADFKRAGGGTLIDAQPVGCGRMARELREVSVISGVNIIASTGFHKMMFYPPEHWIFSASEKELADLFITELTDGMYEDGDASFPSDRTDIKAGLIKTALDSGDFTPQYEKLFGAAASAHMNTGRPIMVHVEKGSDPLMLFDFLTGAGVSPEKMIFCHTDRASGEETRAELLNRGVYLEMDTIGRPKYHDDERELDILFSLIDAGGENKLLFSLDTTNARLKTYTPEGVGLTYILNEFLPKMRQRGLTARQEKLISHDNFVNAFGV